MKLAASLCTHFKWPYVVLPIQYCMVALVLPSVLTLLVGRRCRAAHHIATWYMRSVDFSVQFIGSRPSDHYFRSVCLSVCAEFFSAVFDPISIKLGYMLYVWV